MINNLMRDNIVYGIGVLIQAETGGQHVWHQDYGYWCVMVKHEKMVLVYLYILRYENGCLTPDMGSVFIALDPALKENGCLQVGC